MPELLLELLSEEIPARMQKRAAEELYAAVNDRLLEAGFMPEGGAAFVTPRRLALTVRGLTAAQPDRREERKGPRVGAPDKAIEGFLRGAGLSSIDDAERREDKKGEFYVAVIERKGRPTADVIAEIVPDVVRKFSWPKSMRWGDGDMRWVRPLHSILCTLDGEVVPFEIEGIASGAETRGHRFHGSGAIRVRRFDDYVETLRAEKVVLDREERKDIILHEAKTLCEAQGFELAHDEGLLEEVAGLVEWPVVKLGAFDEKFLELPDEVLATSMRAHQKYFSVRDPNTAKLAPHFVYVANIEAEDGGAAMTKGYERVLTARLSDARFLWDQDRKTKLADRVPDLDKVTFFEGLGSLGDRVIFVGALARKIAPFVKANEDEAEQAATLGKADLVTGMVYEFPELQGVMGRYYALEEGLDADVANAIRDHYKPAGQDDDIPAEPVAIAVALADKLDLLISFWAIDEKPTGSKDPFALRRAALGFAKTAIECNSRIALEKIIKEHALLVRSAVHARLEKAQAQAIREFTKALIDGRVRPGDEGLLEEFGEEVERAWAKAQYIPPALINDLLSFFADRLKVYLRDRGVRHDLIDAVFALPGQDDLVLIVRRVEALQDFLETDDGANLLAAYKRAANILKAEEKKGDRYDGAVDTELLAEKDEKALSKALEKDAGAATAAAEKEDFTAAMAHLARLRKPVDKFFDTVTVNVDDAAIRANRLNLLNRMRAACDAIADFSKIEG